MPWQGLLLVFYARFATAYHHGGIDTNCWFDNFAQFVDPCTFGVVNFLEIPSESTLYTGQLFNVQSLLVVNESLIPEDGYIVPHANVHMCRVEVGFCSPDVQVQPHLVSQTTSIPSNSKFLNESDLHIDEPGEWMIISHYTVFTTEGQWDLAAGRRRTFVAKLTQIDIADWAITLIYSFAGLGIFIATIVFLGIVILRNHWVFRATSPYLSSLMIFGCLLAFIAVFLLPPPHMEQDLNVQAINQTIATVMSSNPSPRCLARLWLLSLAFDFVLIPLALKTWRVAVLFDTSNSFRQRRITDESLIKLAFILVILDVIFCLTWSLAFPLYAASIPSRLNPTSQYVVQCDGENQLIFETSTYVLHGLPLLWLAFIGRKVKLNFKQRSLNIATATEGLGLVQVQATEKKLNQFNESETLSLTLASLACLSIFAIALQYTVQDSPTAQMLMVAGGTLWSSYIILLLMFGPKFVDCIRLQSDGVTQRALVIPKKLSFRKSNSSTESTSSKRQTSQQDLAIL